MYLLPVKSTSDAADEKTNCLQISLDMNAISHSPAGFQPRGMAHSIGRDTVVEVTCTLALVSNLLTHPKKSQAKLQIIRDAANRQGNVTRPAGLKPASNLNTRCSFRKPAGSRTADSLKTRRSTNVHQLPPRTSLYTSRIPHLLPAPTRRQQVWYSN